VSAAEDFGGRVPVDVVRAGRLLVGRLVLVAAGFRTIAVLATSVGVALGRPAVRADATEGEVG
jgi:hypothetical protein